jgi:hypothetical protein
MCGEREVGDAITKMEIVNIDVYNDWETGVRRNPSTNPRCYIAMNLSTKVIMCRLERTSPCDDAKLGRFAVA